MYTYKRIPEFGIMVLVGIARVGTDSAREERRELDSGGQFIVVIRVV